MTEYPYGLLIEMHELIEKENRAARRAASKAAARKGRR